MSTMPYDTGDPDGDWNEDGYALSPGPVSPGVAPAVSPGVSRPGSPAVALIVSPVDDNDREQGNDGREPLGWTGTDRWEPAVDERAAGPAGSGFRLGGHLRALAGSELLGGGPGGLRAELADPHPETMRQHWEHVTGHPWRPDDPRGGAAFAAGHLAVTGPAKAAGKFLVAIGTALVFAGTRIDWAGDRFARTVVPVAVAVTLIVIVLVFA